MFLQQSVVEPLDASFTELIQATDDTPNLLSCGICNKRYKTMSIFAEFVQACSKQRLSILNTNPENIQHHTSALPVASHLQGIPL
jgi:hypothetical protein